MRILQLLSLLMDYPKTSLVEHLDDIKEIIEYSDLPLGQQLALLEFVERRGCMDLIDWQAEYDGLFERGRSLGLWLFEHVHGESRDRGQAMVELIAKYKEANLQLDRHELPDYIPLFLEFLSTQGRDNAKLWLCEVAHILALLQCRLERRGSNYSVLFDALLEFSAADIDIDEIRQQVASEKRDDSKKAIDKEWEEEEVSFGADSIDKACEQANRKPSQSQRKDLDVPLNWVGFNDYHDAAEEGAKQ
ncbi:nitrate reductase molybdenum cofactor assembly chaperone [uncultured Pseudoteredinibacter sp.]|uniref:nitrate reductase molybdenum cofactor assembly chaperone n=1 Tax=uncultured Pseudoteredinibacter sp. TaxID=1641701 RepID=UPI00262FAA44|nr:nitrate reductase molybdenum cofactor assembly chaperone [uncultured Pseudoteredinibacter sp.]